MSEAPRHPESASDLFAWSSFAGAERLDAADVMRLAGDSEMVLGVESGVIHLLGREVRDNGRLGPAVGVGSAGPGRLLVVPEGGSGIQFAIRADDACRAVVLDAVDVGDEPVEGAEHLLGEQFGSLQERITWLEQVRGDAAELTWTAMLTAAPGESRRLAEAAIKADREAFRSRLHRASELDDAMLDEAVWAAVQSGKVRSSRARVGGTIPVDRACRRVAAAVGASVPEHVSYHESSSLTMLEQFARASHLNRRTVLLQGNWWKQEAGPLLAFRRDDQAPVALIPRGRGYLASVMGEDGETPPVRVSATFAATLTDHAEMFYAGLPARTIGLRDILTFVFRGNGRDAMVVVAVMLLTAGLTAIIPIITGMVIDWVLPQVAVNALIFIGILLIAVTLSQALLQVGASFAFLRFETRSSFALMAAFVDRLLQLPASFYRKHNAGDLTQRVMAIEKVRAMFSQSTLSVGIVFLSGLSNLAVLFLYDSTLALWGIGIAALQMLIISSIAVYSAYQNYALSVEKGKLDGLTLDFIVGIRQARTQGSLARVLSQVLQHLAPVGQASYRLGIAGAFNQVVLGSFKSVALVVVFVIFTSQLDVAGTSTMTTGGFVAFVTALAAFFAAAGNLGPAVSAVAEAIPQYHRLRPLMDAVPEVAEGGRETRCLLGDLSVRDIVFRYDEDQPPVLDGVSIDVRRGEFVAIVGRTGCGKSTLMRLMLGLEQPESGAVLYDGVPLDNLDPSVVRSQLGVVMQTNSILPGSVQSTILGAGSDRTVDDAWAAAGMVGMGDEIDAMPMGMSTMVGPSTLSSSQSQRLLIARAIVDKPEILLLDEATSALDHTAQDEIARSIDRLASTRVAIAHRLSTIRKADRIYVLAEGKVVQSGTFEELAGEDGHFRDLMAGQLS